MKITVVSDLHLEFGYTSLPGGEVLILSGDIAEAKRIKKQFERYGNHRSNVNRDFACSEFFWKECAKYQKVFYVMGNHEHYTGDISETKDILKSCIPSNIEILDNDIHEYNGYLFMGATLWTDLNRNDPLTAFHLKDCMNDYHVVKNKGEILRPEHTYQMHRDSMEFFQSQLKDNPDKKFIVVTHHAPSELSIHPRYKYDQLMNGGYFSNLEEFLLDHNNICLWTHGHVHNNFDYLIGETRVICNPRGYQGYESNDNFDPNMELIYE
jgi:Icc-related predicted phosphoesterase